MDVKYQIVSKLLDDEKPNDIAESLGVPYAKVIRIKGQLKKAQEDEKLDEFIDMDAVMMDKLLELAKGDTPAALLDEATGAVIKIKGTKALLDALQEDMVVTAKTLNTRIKSMSLSIDNAAELTYLVESLCKLQNAFFNSNKTQVLIQPGGERGSGYGEFLSDKPKDF